jgi:hypothetical protein
MEEDTTSTAHDTDTGTLIDLDRNIGTDIVAGVVMAMVDTLEDTDTVEACMFFCLLHCI